jgi:hypothetical protein
VSPKGHAAQIIKDLNELQKKWMNQPKIPQNFRALTGNNS